LIPCPTMKAISASEEHLTSDDCIEVMLENANHQYGIVVCSRSELATCLRGPQYPAPP
jgi:hypothetical protein